MRCPHCHGQIDEAVFEGPPPTEEMKADPDFVWLTLCGLCAYLFVYCPSRNSFIQATPHMLEEAPPDLLRIIRQRQRAIYLSQTRN